LAPGEQPSDADLIARHRAGDAAAFDLLVTRWHARIHRWACGWADDPDEADDLTQQVLVRVHLRLSGFRGTSAFSTWLYGITRNAARDAFRRRRRREQALSRLETMSLADEPDADPAEALDRRAAVDTARGALAGLPPRQREVFDLVDLQGYAPHEAAALLGLSHGTVRAHLFRARRAVRAAVLALDPALAEEYGC
jgi:RNA polymerase sigma-70 factor (ECF subfamily)